MTANKMSAASKKFQFKPKAVVKEGVEIVTTPITNAHTGMEAVMNIVLAHTADVFRAVVDAVAEHYSLDKEEMMEVITRHPKFVEVTTHPVLSDAGAFSKVPVTKEPIDELTEATAAMTIAAAASAAPVSKKRFVIRKTKTPVAV